MFANGPLAETLESRVVLAAGATVPYITYEAEAGTVSGALLGPSFAQHTVAGESSGRSAVRLSGAGQFVQITAAANANSMVVRYSIPDSPTGGGIDSTLNLLVNGVVVKTLALTSKYSYLYGAYPFVNTPGSGSPRNFFDEVRATGLSIQAGDTVRVQRSAADAGAYCDVDLIDLENVAAPIAQPAGNWISVSSFNAVGDGIADDTTAIRNTVNAAISQGKNVWVPAGKYKVSGFISGLQNVTIQGAGMWHTTFLGDASLYNTASRRVGFMGAGNNVHLNDFAITGNLTYRNDSESNDGIGGSFGTGSTMSRLWIEHTKVGMWLVNSNGLAVNDCRFRNTIADGMNFVVGMRNSTAINCTARGTGDDCFAIWPATYIAQTNSPGFNTYSHCTGQVPWLANGGAIYGGASNTIDQCRFQDIPYGSGILISGTFEVGSNTFTGTTTASSSELIRAGGGKFLAAMQFAMNNDPIAGVVMNGLNIIDSPYSGVGVNNAQTLTATASNLQIATVGLTGSSSYGIYAQNNSNGSLTLSNSTIADYNNASPNFNLNIGNTTGPLPTPWLAGDAGDVGVKGNATHNSGQFTINGSGAGIGGTADGFRFVAQSVTGDQTIVARVASLIAVNASAKAGVMFRATTSANAMFAAISVTPGNGVTFQYRTAAGAVAVTSATIGSVAAPQWLKLLRSGNQFSAYCSNDGTTWTQVGTTQTIGMSPSALAGLAVTSHDNSRIATAAFNNVSVKPTFASLAGTTLNVTFSSADPISLSASGNSIVASQAGATLTFSNVNNIVVTFDQSNDNVLNLNSAIAASFAFTGTGENDTINVNAGTLIVPSDLRLAATNIALNIASGAAVLFQSSQHLESLNLASDGRATTSGGAGQVLVTRNLSMEPSATLDLNDGNFVVDYTSGSSPGASVQSLIIAARAGGAWNGPGITSSAAKNATPRNSTLGVIEASEFKSIYGHNALFAGEAIDETAVLIKYTYYGDADFNGTVNFDDYARIDAGFSANRTGWLSGDFDGNGQVNFDDYTLIDLAFNTQGSPLRPSIGDAGGKGARGGLR